MKKLFPTALIFLFFGQVARAQNIKTQKPSMGSLTSELKSSKPAESFLVIHKERDSPFEIYQDMIQDQIVIRLKNQFDILRFEIKNDKGKTMSVQGTQDKNEVHAELKDLPNGRYRLLVDRNNDKIFTEFFIER